MKFIYFLSTIIVIVAALVECFTFITVFWAYIAHFSSTYSMKSRLANTFAALLCSPGMCRSKTHTPCRFCNANKQCEQDGEADYGLCVKLMHFNLDVRKCA